MTKENPFSRRDCVRGLPSQRSARRKKGGEAPKDASHPLSAPILLEGRRCGSGPLQTSLHSQACAVCATYLLAGTARLPALRGGACPGERTPELSPGRASRETRCEGVSSALESRLSKAPCTPVLMPAGSLPGPPGSGVTSPARRNRTRSINWLSPADVPDVSETAAVMVIAAAKSKAVHLCRWINNFRAARFSEKGAHRA